jgi:predicted DNA-binding transcriptional regulator YafY
MRFSMDGLADDDLMTAHELAEYFGCSERKLEMDRRDGSGVPYIRINARNVRYRVGDVRAFLKARTFRHHAEELSQAAA